MTKSEAVEAAMDLAHYYHCDEFARGHEATTVILSAQRPLTAAFIATETLLRISTNPRAKEMFLRHLLESVV